MPKKKRTLKQKLQADMRQHAPTSAQTTPEESNTHYTLEHVSLPKAKPKAQTLTHTAVISTREYAYLGFDLRKTFLITAAVVLVELAIRFFALSNY